MNWTPETVDELMTMWAGGLTSYQLADHFKTSRNAIMGKVHRERLRRAKQGEPTERRVAVQSSDTVSKRRYTRREPMLTLASSAGSVMRIVEPTPTPPDQGQLASIVDVTGCRWPVKDDPEYIGGVAFCNHGQRDGSPYCEYHARVNVAPWSAEAIRKTFKQVNFLLKRSA